MFKKEAQEKGELKILCPFCGAPYDAQMRRTLEVESLGACSCGAWSQHVDTIDITCTNCGKLVYRKEIRCDEDLD